MSEAQLRHQNFEPLRSEVSPGLGLVQTAAHRAVAAAALIPAGARVLEVGLGVVDLKPHLPFGCAYAACNITDLKSQTVPLAAVTAADLVVMLGVWEHIPKPDDVFAAFARTGKPLLCSYADGQAAPLQAFLHAAGAHGYRAVLTKKVDAAQYLIRFERTGASAPQKRKRVHVISYNNIGNFGDRLGYHLLNDVLPAHAELTWGSLRPFAAVPPDVDLLVIGIGNSLFGELLDDQLIAATAKAKASIGIFGTQYRAQLPQARLAQLVDRLTHWYARYEEDILLYGRGRANVSHLGDWLINAFPLAVPGVDQMLHIGGGILKNLPMDRTIQHIQRHRRVFSERLHPLLCALTSAEFVAYVEQRESADKGLSSGKFRSLLMDVFGEALPENVPWKVDRDRVAAYKAKVRRNTDAMRDKLADLLS